MGRPISFSPSMRSPPMTICARRISRVSASRRSLCAEPMPTDLRPALLAAALSPLHRRCFGLAVAVRRSFAPPRPRSGSARAHQPRGRLRAKPRKGRAADRCAAVAKRSAIGSQHKARLCHQRRSGCRRGEQRRADDALASAGATHVIGSRHARRRRSRPRRTRLLSHALLADCRSGGRSLRPRRSPRSLLI